MCCVAAAPTERRWLALITHLLSSSISNSNSNQLANNAHRISNIGAGLLVAWPLGRLGRWGRPCAAAGFLAGFGGRAGASSN